MRTLLTAIALVFVCAAGVSAQDAPIVRVEVTPQTVNVGEAVTMRVTVLVPTWFARPPIYPSFELANAITRLPPDNSFPTSQRVGSETWSGIVRDYRIYPLLGARYELAGQTISISYANPGAQPSVVDAEIPAVSFRGAVPSGAESLDPYIAGSKLSVTLEAEGGVDELNAGDAVVLRYRAELDGLPAIFLPPLAPSLEFDGVSAYADQPDVEDGTPAVRSETVTLVFESGGEFLIPGVELNYWNTASGKVETARADGISLAVTGSAALVGSPSDGENAATPKWPLALAVAVLLIAGFAAWRWVPVARQRWHEAVLRRRQTEAYAFRQMRVALKANDAATAYQALLVWLERLQPDLDSRSFATASEDPELERVTDQLSQHIYADAPGSPDLRRSAAVFSAARRRFLSRSRASVKHALPELNP